MDNCWLLIITIVTLLIIYLRFKFQYWTRRGVLQPGVNNYVGTFFQLKTIHSAELIRKHYENYRGKVKVLGSYLYLQPILFAIDLDLVKHVLIKDFNNFVEREPFKNVENDPLTLNIFHLDAERWRSLRNRVTPVFTSGKMKLMFPIIQNVADHFIELCKQELTNSKDGILELYELSARFTTDVIGNCILGIECNSLNETNGEFRRIGREIFQPPFASIKWRLFCLRHRDFLRKLGFRMSMMNVYDFIYRITMETMEYRNKHNIKRNDFIGMLIDLRNQKDDKGNYCLTINEMVAQFFLFFAAGFETSSSSITYTIFELAKHPDMQQKLRDEINTVLQQHNGELTYECMDEMKYLNQVFTESMRLYPALHTLTRVPKEDYKIPGTDIIIPKGVDVFIPVYEIHHDPEIYENPESFIPERFSPEEIKNRHPQSFLNFGDGPRNCLGLRFGKMQTRIGIIKLIQNFRFEICKDSPTHFEPSVFSVVTSPSAGCLLKAYKV